MIGNLNLWHYWTWFLLSTAWIIKWLCVINIILKDVRFSAVAEDFPICQLVAIVPNWPNLNWQMIFINNLNKIMIFNILFSFFLFFSTPCFYIIPPSLIITAIDLSSMLNFSFFVMLILTCSCHSNIFQKHLWFYFW